MRLPKRIAAVGTAGLIAGAIAGVSPASAAQNYAPQCEASASIVSLADLKVGYKIVCTDFSSSNVVATQGDVNGGAWEAKDYSEGTFVSYTDGKWYKAASDVTAADEPSKPANDDEGNPVIKWTLLSTDTSAAWSASSTSATTTAGSFPAGYVVNYTVSGTKHWWKANAATVAADVPGTSAKWDDLGTTAYTGPQPAGSKTVTVKYPALVSGYSVIALNNLVNGFDTEPAVLNAAGDAPAPNQTQYCNGDHPGTGVSCSLQSGVNVYAQAADSSYLKVTGATLAVKSGSTYTDLKSTSLFADNSLTGSPSLLSSSTDFLSLGALGLPTNSGKKIMPATSGSQITGELELDSTPCGWGNGLKLVAILSDPEGQMNTPIEISLPESKYFKLVKVGGVFTEQHIQKNCTFQNGYYNTQVYYRDGSGAVQKVAKVAKKTPAQTITATD